MKFRLFIPGLIIFVSCTNKKLNFPQPSTPAAVDSSCVYKSNTIISYSTTVGPMLMDNCIPCHSSPTSFAFDNYAAVKANALSGNLMTAVIKNQTTGFVMPPEPQKALDSCQIKALNLWLAQGCQNN